MSVLEKLKKQQGTKRPKPPVISLDSEEDVTSKVLLYGHSGSGKTFFAVGPLEAGERVFVLSSDFGSHGLMTVRQELKRRGKAELLKNIKAIEVNTYEDVVGFLENPLDYYPDLLTFNPTVLMWEGFSYFNIGILDEYILKMAPGAENAGEMRYAGWTHTKQDWQGMKRGTIRTLGKFMSWSLPPDPPRPVHKILTCLEAQPEVDDLTQKVQRSVLVHGTGKSLMGPAFDAILECFKEEKDGVVKFCYRCEGSSDKFLIKSRGFDLQPMEEADPTRIWRILAGRGEDEA